MRQSAALLLATLMLAGCASVFDARDPGYAPVTAAGDYASGSPLAAYLRGADRAQLSEAFLAAMNSTAGSASESWSGRNGQGTVTAREVVLKNLFSNPETTIKAAAGIDPDHAMRTDLGEYVVSKDANIRLAPSTDGRRVNTLAAGTRLQALGRVRGAEWLLVAKDNVAIGYIFEPLTAPAPGRDLVLAGGPLRTPELCRRFTQTLSARGQTDEWSGLACQSADGVWRVQQTDARPLV